MALSDYLKGPQHKARSVELEAELRVSGRRCASIEAELAALKDRYAELQELAKKYGAMEAAEVQREISAERRVLQTVKDAGVVDHETQVSAIRPTMATESGSAAPER